MRHAILALALMVAVAPVVASQTGAKSPDRAAVEAAALDYVEGLYNADPSRIERSVHQQLTKRGFWRDSATAPWGPQLTMTYEQLIALSKKWNADKKQDISIKRVDVRRAQRDRTGGGNRSGQLTFDRTYTRQFSDEATLTPSNLGLSLAAFELGLPTNAQINDTVASSFSTPARSSRTVASAVIDLVQDAM